ncbi:substrate-binding domain-containing protein, partial [bacterium]|nr:substrate-binding domain-containing protein [bacterium]
MSNALRIPATRALAWLPALLAALFVPRALADDDRARVVVLAAASLADVVQAVAPLFPDARVDAGFGGSGALARQIRDGAPGDVFLSASPGWIDFLRAADALDGDAIVLARNRLVCIA